MDVETVQRIEPSPGLVAAFSLIRESDCTATWAKVTARESLPFAQRLIEELRSNGESTTVRAVLDAAAIDMFEWDTPADEHPELTQRSAYYVGFAVCWLLMRDIAGGAR